MLEKRDAVEKIRYPQSDVEGQADLKKKDVQQGAKMKSVNRVSREGK